MGILDGLKKQEQPQPAQPAVETENPQNVAPAQQEQVTVAETPEIAAQPAENGEIKEEVPADEEIAPAPRPELNCGECDGEGLDKNARVPGTELCKRCNGTGHVE